MDVKRQIEKFRSEALMSRYENAIQLGYLILQRLTSFQKIFNQDFTQIKKEIQVEVNYCIDLNKFTSHNLVIQNISFLGKKSFSQTQKSLSQEKQNGEIVKKVSWNKKEKSSESQNQLTCLNLNQRKEQEENHQTVQQKIHKQIILPLNMPLFKLKKSVFLVKAQNCLNEILEYLVHYDFKQFPSLKQCDLGVQNICNIKSQMNESNENRGVIVIQKNQQKICTRSEINKLVKVIEAYRESNQENDTQKKNVLVILFEEEDKQKQNWRHQPSKSVSFL